MSPQIVVALRRSIALVVIAAVALVLDHYGDLRYPPSYFVVGLIAIAVVARLIEGVQDSERARKFNIQVGDVGYAELESYRGEPPGTWGGVMRGPAPEPEAPESVIAVGPVGPAGPV